MKKLLTFAVVSALCGVVSAASIDWTISGINKTKTQINDAKGNAFNGTVYLIFASDASQLAAANTSNFGDTINSIKLDSADVSNGKVSVAATADSTRLVARGDNRADASKSSRHCGVETISDARAL